MEAAYRKSILKGYGLWKNSQITWLNYDRPSENKIWLWRMYTRQFKSTLRFLSKNCHHFSCAGWDNDEFHYLTGMTDYHCSREELNALLSSNT